MMLKSKSSKRALDLRLGAVNLLLVSWLKESILRAGIQYGGFATDLDGEVYGAYYPLFIR